MQPQFDILSRVGSELFAERIIEAILSRDSQTMFVGKLAEKRPYNFSIGEPTCRFGPVTANEILGTNEGTGAQRPFVEIRIPVHFHDVVVWALFPAKPDGYQTANGIAAMNNTNWRQYQFVNISVPFLVRCDIYTLWEAIKNDLFLGFDVKKFMQILQAEKNLPLLLIGKFPHKPAEWAMSVDSDLLESFVLHYKVAWAKEVWNHPYIDPHAPDLAVDKFQNCLLVDVIAFGDLLVEKVLLPAASAAVGLATDAQSNNPLFSASANTAAEFTASKLFPVSLVHKMSGQWSGFVAIGSLESWAAKTSAARVIAALYFEEMFGGLPPWFQAPAAVPSCAGPPLPNFADSATAMLRDCLAGAQWAWKVDDNGKSSGLTILIESAYTAVRMAQSQTGGNKSLPDLPFFKETSPVIPTQLGSFHCVHLALCIADSTVEALTVLCAYYYMKLLVFAVDQTRLWFQQKEQSDCGESETWSGVGTDGIDVSLFGLWFIAEIAAQVEAEPYSLASLVSIVPAAGADNTYASGAFVNLLSYKKGLSCYDAWLWDDCLIYAHAYGALHGIAISKFQYSYELKATCHSYVLADIVGPYNPTSHVDEEFAVGFSWMLDHANAGLRITNATPFPSFSFKYEDWEWEVPLWDIAATSFSPTNGSLLNIFDLVCNSGGIELFSPKTIMVFGVAKLKDGWRQFGAYRKCGTKNGNKETIPSGLSLTDPSYNFGSSLYHAWLNSATWKFEPAQGVDSLFEVWWWPGAFQQWQTGLPLTKLADGRPWETIGKASLVRFAGGAWDSGVDVQQVDVIEWLLGADQGTRAFVASIGGSTYAISASVDNAKSYETVSILRGAEALVLPKFDAMGGVVLDAVKVRFGNDGFVPAAGNAIVPCGHPQSCAPIVDSDTCSSQSVWQLGPPSAWPVFGQAKGSTIWRLTPALTSSWKDVIWGLRWRFRIGGKHIVSIEKKWVGFSVPFALDECWDQLVVFCVPDKCIDLMWEGQLKLVMVPDASGEDRKVWIWTDFVSLYVMNYPEEEMTLDVGISAMGPNTEFESKEKLVSLLFKGSSPSLKQLQWTVPYLPT